MKSHLSVLLFALSLVPTHAAGQEVRFDDVIRNLRNPDPDARVQAVRMLRHAKYPEAVRPMAALVTDPVDEIQLEAIAAELSFFTVDEIQSRRRFAFIVEKRSAAHAAAVFEAGPLAVWPRDVPAELIRGLLAAADDENARVRLEAIYALGAIARAPFPAEYADGLVKVLDHYDPSMRAAAARVIGRLGIAGAAEALLRAVNDSNASVRYAAMRALGYLREERAVRALVAQLEFYGRGEGAWSALDALARIGHGSSIPLFTARLQDRDPFIRRAAAEGLGRAGATSAIAALEVGAGNDSEKMVRAAMAFALQKLGRNYAPRLADMMDSPAMAAQVAEYFLELGPSIVPALTPHLQDTDPAIRANVAQVIGAVGGDDALPLLQPLTQDPDRDVVKAAARAIERLTLRRG